MLFFYNYDMGLGGFILELTAGGISISLELEINISKCYVISILSTVPAKKGMGCSSFMHALLASNLIQAVEAKRAEKSTSSRGVSGA
jgi:hypothetical protein